MGTLEVVCVFIHCIYMINALHLPFLDVDYILKFPFSRRTGCTLISLPMGRCQCWSSASTTTTVVRRIAQHWTWWKRISTQNGMAMGAKSANTLFENTVFPSQVCQILLGLVLGLTLVRRRWARIFHSKNVEDPMPLSFLSTSLLSDAGHLVILGSLL